MQQHGLCSCCHDAKHLTPRESSVQALYYCPSCADEHLRPLRAKSAALVERVAEERSLLSKALSDPSPHPSEPPELPACSLSYLSYLANSLRAESATLKSTLNALSLYIVERDAVSTPSPPSSLPAAAQAATTLASLPSLLTSPLRSYHSLLSAEAQYLTSLHALRLLSTYYLSHHLPSSAVPSSSPSLPPVPSIRGLPLPTRLLALSGVLPPAVLVAALSHVASLASDLALLYGFKDIAETIFAAHVATTNNHRDGLESGSAEARVLDGPNGTLYSLAPPSYTFSPPPRPSASSLPSFSSPPPPPLHLHPPSSSLPSAAGSAGGAVTSVASAVVGAVAGVGYVAAGAADLVGQGLFSAATLLGDAMSKAGGGRRGSNAAQDGREGVERRRAESSTTKHYAVEHPERDAPKRGGRRNTTAEEYEAGVAVLGHRVRQICLRVGVKAEDVREGEAMLENFGMLQILLEERVSNPDGK